ncbi:MAG: hypothetical protein PWP54_1017 [Thermosipho sp. (in: thermotogales)]|nr:hypothetical protein [Thermosipho sp. (in: thermotogales)]MDN5325096.1 hypothetical protein [Thermosipho sp. (in: thermotogales)]
MLFLGIDGGGTKTKAVLVSEDGKLLGLGLSGPTNLLENGEKLFIENLKKCLSGLLKKVKNKEVISCFGLPAIGEFKDSEKVVSKILETNFNIRPRIIVNDVVIGWAAGTLGKDGIHIVAGTGAIVFGKKGDKTIRVTGWGSLIGDEGSAYHIGLETLREVSKQLDGRSRKTVLTEIVFNGLNLKTHYDFIDFVYSADDRRKKIAFVAQLTYEAALQNDFKALKILKNAGKELGLSIYAGVKKLGLINPLITYNGSVLEKNLFVRKAFEEYLNKKILNPIIKQVEFDPVLGAIVLAYKEKYKEIPEDFILKLKKINNYIIN